MKRILAIILAALMVVSFMGYAEESAEVKAEASANTDYSDALALLRLTGILDDEFVLTDSNAKRGSFAAFLVRAKGMKTYVFGYGSDVFSDVGSDNPYYSEIAAAKDMGLINGYSDGSFRPDNDITLFEAAICLTRVLGYSIKAEGMGGYPSGYHAVIRETELLDGISAPLNEPASLKNVITLIYNALHTKVLEASGVSSDGGFILEAENGKTLLYNSFGLSFTDGVVNGVDITNLYGKNDLPYYCIYVGDEVFYTETDINYLLGYHIRAYYKLEKEKTRIKLAIKDKKKNNENIINISDVVSISDGTLVAEGGEGKEKKYSYDRTAPVIYNGANTKADFNTGIYVENGKVLSGTVKLLDNNNDKKADVVFIDAYEDMVAGRIDAENSVVYDYFDSKKKIALPVDTADPYVLIYDESGEAIEASGIPAGASITVYKSKSDAWQTFIKVYVSTSEISGMLERSEEINGKLNIYIEGKPYALSDYAIANSIGISIGRTADVLLNHMGEIARFSYSTEPGDYTWGLISAVKNSGGFEGRLQVRVMDSSESFNDTIFADKVKVDGAEINLGSQTAKNSFIALLRKASTAISGRTYEQGSADPYCFQLVKYGINKDGEINYVDTILDENGDIANAESIKLDNEVYYGVIDSSKPEYTSSVNMISQKIIVANEYNVFMYPGEGFENDSTYYAVRGSGYFVNGGSQHGLLWFKDNDEDFTASVFLRQYSSAGIDDDMPTFKTHIVTKITDAVNSEGEKRKKWYLYSQGEAKEILVDPELYSTVSEGNQSTVDSVLATEVSEGDIIYITENTVTGELDLFVMLYSFKNNKYYPEEGKNKIEPSYAIKSTRGGIKLIYHSDAPDGIESGVNSTAYRLFNNIKNATGITYYNTKTKKARQGSYNDITGYLDNPDEYTSELIVRWYHPTSKIIREMFVYER